MGLPAADAHALLEAFKRPIKGPPYPAGLPFFAGDSTGDVVRSMARNVFADAVKNVYNRLTNVGKYDLAALILLNDTQPTYQSDPQAGAWRVWLPKPARQYALEAMLASHDVVTWSQWTGGTTRMPQALAKIISRDPSAAIRITALDLLNYAAIPTAWLEPLVYAIKEAQATLPEMNWTQEERVTVKQKLEDREGSLKSGAANDARQVIMNTGFPSIPGMPGMDIPVVPPAAPPPRPKTDWAAYGALGGAGLFLLLLGSLIYRRKHHPVALPASALSID